MARPTSLSERGVTGRTLHYSQPRIIEPRKPTPCDSYGDFDNDGWVTWYDATLLRSYVYGGWANVKKIAERLGISLNIDEGEFVRRADLNGDGIVDERDLWYLENYLDGNYAVPVCPKPEPRRATREHLFPRLYMRTSFPRIERLRCFYLGEDVTVLESLFPRTYYLLRHRKELWVKKGNRARKAKPASLLEELSSNGIVFNIVAGALLAFIGAGLALLTWAAVGGFLSSFSDKLLPVASLLAFAGGAYSIYEAVQSREELGIVAVLPMAFGVASLVEGILMLQIFKTLPPLSP
ncbi:MAG TPA: hypothetical protein ENF26_01040 [Methanomicrobia archaeon]|nr:hypothetical protein [Methanomicrobia archaeon]HEX58717.1 hypothetical protein [Methanomicrobia archaeon]